MAFDLMRGVLLTRGAKRRQVQICLSDCLFIFGSPTYALSRRLASVLVLCLGVQAVETIPAQRFGSGLQLVVIRLAESAKCRSCSSRLPVARWRARQGGGCGSGGGEVQKVRDLLLGPAGPNTPAKKKPAKAQSGAQNKAPAKAQSGAPGTSPGVCSNLVV